MQFINHIRTFLQPRHKVDFLSSLPPTVSILDVGFGNNSPCRTKDIFPNCNYVGLDIGDYNLENTSCADQYLLTTPQNFANKIAQFSSVFDVVVSSHNLEHCNERCKVLESMIGALKNEGEMYLSFPCEQSVFFPSREEL